MGKLLNMLWVIFSIQFTDMDCQNTEFLLLKNARFITLVTGSYL